MTEDAQSIVRPATLPAAQVVAPEPPARGLAPVEPVAATRSGGSDYRPHLDGLRAVAVYLVVVFHAGVARVSGGFIGVDVFFVLSGFLVTRLLLRDLDGGGSVRFGRFYARRFRRLLPASAVALLVTAVVYSATAGPGEAASAVGAFRACFLYVANWFFIRESAGYFGAAVQSNPVLHFWSLAVEEQFYLVWPLVLGGLFWLFRRGSRNPIDLIRVVVVVGGLASLGWALLLRGSNPNRAYYGTDARAYQLLAGAFLALTPMLVTQLRRLGPMVRPIGIMALGALLALATSLIDVGPIWRGAATAALVVALLASLEAAPSGPLHAVLSWGPLIYLGRISYGIYLWHWPVIIVATLVADPSPIGLLGLSVLIGTGLAALSYELLEMPIRRSVWLDRNRIVVIGAGLTLSLVSGLVLVPAILRHESTGGASASVDAPEAGFTPVPASLDLDQVQAEGYGTAPVCLGKDPSACTIVQGQGKHIALIGDSNAEMMIPAFEAFARSRNLTLSVAATASCPWQLGRLSPTGGTDCNTKRNDLYNRLIPAWDPDIVVAINAAYGPQIEGIQGIRSTTLASLPRLEARGRTIVLVEPIVQAPIDPEPLPCLQNATFLEDCRFVAPSKPNDVEQFYRQRAKKDPAIRSADFDPMVCPYLPICDPVIAGHVVRWNHHHLAIGYTRTLADEVATWFDRSGLLDG